MRNPTYVGIFGQGVTVENDGPPRKLNPVPSQHLCNHSPDGFSWGYGGSGPAQLALAILLDYTNDPKFALEHHQKFKWDLIAHLSPSWTFTGADVAEWIRSVTRIEPEAGGDHATRCSECGATAEHYMTCSHRDL